MIYRARVIYNNDPQKLGRIKVEVPPFLVTRETALSLQMDTQGMMVEDIPWATPAFPLFDGSGAGTGCFCVPKLNTFVFVFFENNDIYQPVYFAEAPDATRGVPSESGVGYPYTKVMKTSAGVTVYIKDTPSAVEIAVTHPSGSYIKMLSDGNVQIHSDNDMIISAGGQVIITGSTINLN